MKNIIRIVTVIFTLLLVSALCIGCLPVKSSDGIVGVWSCEDEQGARWALSLLENGTLMSVTPDLGMLQGFGFWERTAEGRYVLTINSVLYGETVLRDVTLESRDLLKVNAEPCVNCVWTLHRESASGVPFDGAVDPAEELTRLMNGGELFESGFIPCVEDGLSD